MKYSLLAALVVLLSLVYFSCENNNESDINENIDFPDLFPKETGKDVIYVANVPELMATTRLTKEGNKVVIIKDGEYEISEPIRISGDGIIYRSESENRDRVIIKGKGITGNITQIFTVSGKTFGLKDISLGEVSGSGIVIHGEKNTDSIYVQNVRFYNTRNQMILASCDEDYSDDHADFGTIEDCLFEHTNHKTPAGISGGVDIYSGSNWRISNCTFKNINTADHKESSGAIRFRKASEKCTAENNVIINCDRGILFGTNNEAHTGGIIRNNMIYVTRESGIYICNAKDVKVYNNTIFSSSDYPNSIECFDEEGNIEIINNLTNKNISSKNQSTARVENNITHAEENWFKNASQGNLHLAKNVTEVVNTAITLDDVSIDKDGDRRMAYMSDIGADER
ncbi:right-handed parallel beta-helix repeat-containing protein [Saccharicrinis sp. FJH54]|uniref:right-handed parallel beta-helix repeat-containing protein n=1 Tax=Saccharicrinis sp. FJH54 TaxID=3344665 RepID=UPI0035D4CB53